MEIHELVNKIRSRDVGTEDVKFLDEIANKIEWLQKLIDNMTNDHFVDVLDFYFERCQKLEEDFTELVMTSPEICSYCKNKIECEGKKCPKYIEGRSCWDDKRCYHDWAWSCKDFNFGTCDMLEKTPCNGCFKSNNKGFEWRGNK